MNPEELIDKEIESLGDWRGKLIAKIRKVILATNPEIVEEWKWNVPVWSHKGSICAAGAFKDHVKINFFKGALLVDSKKLFNAGLEAKTSRAIDIYEGDPVDEKALTELVQEAIAYNTK